MPAQVCLPRTQTLQSLNARRPVSQACGSPEPRYTPKSPDQKLSPASGLSFTSSFPKSKGTLADRGTRVMLCEAYEVALLLQDALVPLPETHPNNYAKDR